MIRKFSFSTKTRLLVANKRPFLFISFATIGLMTGFLILLLSTQLYIDLQTIDQEESTRGETYRIINKKIGFLDTLKIRNNGFQPDEIEELNAQPFIARTVPFHSNRFNASLYIGGANFPRYSVDLFFESIEQEMIDVPLNEEQWNWKEEDAFVPVIIPNTFFALYNFGFAPSRGLPNLSEEMAKVLNLHMIISDGKRSEEKIGRIIGFSKRINSLLVPKNFMDWANDKYSSKGVVKPLPARIMAAVRSNGLETFENYLTGKNWQTNEEKQIPPRVYQWILIALTGFIAIGLLVSFLSILVSLLTLKTFILGARKNITRLSLLGISEKVARSFYFKIGFATQIIALADALILFYIARIYWLPVYERMGITTPVFLSKLPLLAACGLLIFSTLLFRLSLNRQISKLIQ